MVNAPRLVTVVGSIIYFPCDSPIDIVSDFWRQMGMMLVGALTDVGTSRDVMEQLVN